MSMKTLFLQAPSFDGFDGGAGSRYQAKREIKSFWYPTWLAQPAALRPDAAGIRPQVLAPDDQRGDRLGYLHRHVAHAAGIGRR